MMALISTGDLMQCIMCGVKTDLLKSFERITVGFCGEHYPEESNRKIVLTVESV